MKITEVGTAKRWGGIALRTQCGAANYQAPELLGILPKELMSKTKKYTNYVDIWALGAIVHQMLTSEIPCVFEEQGANWTSLNMEFDRGSGSGSVPSSSVDHDLLFDYCRGVKPFPTAGLITNGVSTQGVGCGERLMVQIPAPCFLQHGRWKMTG